DWPGSALASPGQSLIRLFYPLQASFLYCPHNMGRFKVAGCFSFCLEIHIAFSKRPSPFLPGGGVLQ
ncbi:hypothetical protein, partial [Faecalibacterium sp. An192]|uniref:hypothetical protein n=1 Tax=Faecalibacterium sp. An192 TaxID=1965581 RepID=UPI000B551073